MHTAFARERGADRVPGQTGLLRDVAQCEHDALFHRLEPADVEVCIRIGEQRGEVGGTLAHRVLHVALGLPWRAVEWALARPVWTPPQFSLSALIGVALPLFVVTMASQNLPGVAAQRAAGYATPVSASITVTGAASLLLAPFGGYALNLAAITAAICWSARRVPVGW